eukprot:TRINITY_DN1601_c0_g1_i1.p1 TRINITY_DN1601_c0_g1~~TRINITY_DN1601_c0_g1_i1.p1  ORF type:complete len:407 (+),score=51.65 TRINITY_DN1601_c0_g1_i1:73-1221(+)
MAITYLEGLKGNFPAFTEDVDQMVTLYNKKHWHELTEFLLVLVDKEAWANGAAQLDLYQNFIRSFESKMNLFSLGKIMVSVTQKLPHEQAAAVCCEVADTVKKNNLQAYFLLKTEAATHKIELNEVLVAKGFIEEATTYLSNNDVSTLEVDLRANIYKSQSCLLKKEAKYDEFYKTSLLYIAHVKTELLPESVQEAIAFEVGIAAVLSKSIHNFGELIHHPIIETLKKSNNAWLAELLSCFNVGNFDAYSELAKQHGKSMEQYFGSSNIFQKLQLMALLHFLFSTPVYERTLSFASIHEKCKTESIKDVEPLLLRALALGLIRGSIDEVDQVIEVTWIAARALGKSEVADLVQHVKAWGKQVQLVLSETSSTLQQHEDQDRS